MKNYVFKDRDMKPVFYCDANDITEAQDLATAAGIKGAHMLTVAIGGVMIIRKGTGRTALIKAAHSYVRKTPTGKVGVRVEAQTLTFPAPLVTDKTLFADSIDDALFKYHALVEKYRYDPDTIFLWRGGDGYHTIIKNLGGRSKPGK